MCLLDAWVFPPALDAVAARPDDLMAVGVVPEVWLAGDADDAGDAPMELGTKAGLAEVWPPFDRGVNGSVAEQKSPRPGIEQLSVVVTGMKAQKMPEEQL